MAKAPCFGRTRTGVTNPLGEPSRTDAAYILATARRICVVGMGGKTSFCHALGAARQLPVIDLDAICWKPNWVVRERDEQFEMLRAAVSANADGWITDGNLSQAESELLLPNADAVLWLHMPHFQTWRRITWRSISRAWDGRRVCGDNYENFWHILGRRSMIWWVMFHWRERHRIIRERLATVQHDATLIRVTTYRQLDLLYAALGLDAKVHRT